MKSTEIRVGNIVYADIGLPVMQQHRIVPADISDIDIGKASVGPVTLTEEWLLKFGFVKYCDNWHIKVDKNALNDIYKGWFTIYDEFDGSYSIPMGDYRNDTNASIRYVHQLQNLYFALTGEELSL